MVNEAMESKYLHLHCSVVYTIEYDNDSYGYTEEIIFALRSRICSQTDSN